MLLISFRFVEVFLNKVNSTFLNLLYRMCELKLDSFLKKDKTFRSKELYVKEHIDIPFDF